MLHYPKIPGSRNAPDGRCVAFEKYDGTNLHWDWDRDFGWHAFGTRRDEFNLTDAGIGIVHPTARASAAVRRGVPRHLGRGLEHVFRDHPSYTGFQSLKAFTEFLGPNSFAGLHKEDDPKELRLFDVWAEPFGMVGPQQFVADFGHLPIARVVYEGRLTGKFAEDVRAGKYGVAEGVVCKGGHGRAERVDGQDQDVRLHGAAQAGVRGPVGGVLGVAVPERNYGLTRRICQRPGLKAVFAF